MYIFKVHFYRICPVALDLSRREMRLFLVSCYLSLYGLRFHTQSSGFKSKGTWLIIKINQGGERAVCINLHWRPVGFQNIKMSLKEDVKIWA